MATKFMYILIMMPIREFFLCKRNKATDLTDWKQNNDCLLIRPCLSLDKDIGRTGQVVLLLTITT